MILAAPVSRLKGMLTCCFPFSQGAQVIHNAANMITAAQSNFINSGKPTLDPVLALGQKFSDILVCDFSGALR